MGLHPSPLPEIGTFLTVSVSALSLHSFYNPTTFCLFSFFSQCKDKYSTNLTINEKSINGVLGTSAARLGDILDFGQLFKALGNN